MKVKSEGEVAQSCLTPRDPMDCSLPGSSIHGIFQARVLEWGAIAFSQRSLVGYSPWGRKRTGHNLSTKEQQKTYFNCSCKAILMATNSFNFSLSDKVLLSSPSGILTAYATTFLVIPKSLSTLFWFGFFFSLNLCPLGFSDLRILLKSTLALKFFPEPSSVYK